MTNYHIQRNERRARRKALLITAFFHVVLLAAFFHYNGDTDWSQLVPDQVKEWLQIDNELERKSTTKPQAQA